MLLTMRARGMLLVTFRQVSYLTKKHSYYDILGVKSDATIEEIRAAFVKKSNEVKEAYDCLRNPEKRAAYDDQCIVRAGYLKEATHLKFKEDTIIDLNRARNDSYTGPRGPNAEESHHFRDFEEEYYREKYKNRMLVVLGGVMACLILTNIGYIW
ncbi:DnaJ domain protein [Necator americanus]|uniref:DnaJ domain protein n=1 Tax=Necator americanus TaxID=51031 RepID=W2SJ16_NECAM|nr:DnaJ domain protein [Necator americanus]ETN69649.1 DnaJ domain protein [Necator americanus]